MKIVKVDYEIVGLSGGNITFRVYHDVRMVSVRDVPNKMKLDCT